MKEFKAKVDVYHNTKASKAEERRALEDLEYWRGVADILDCRVYGFTFRERASLSYGEHQPKSGHFAQSFEIPGAIAERILALANKITEN